jgi:hypothetical protein
LVDHYHTCPGASSGPGLGRIGETPENGGASGLEPKAPIELVRSVAHMVRTKVERDRLGGCVGHRCLEQSSSDPALAMLGADDDILDVVAQAPEVSMRDPAVWVVSL